MTNSKERAREKAWKLIAEREDRKCLKLKRMLFIKTAHGKSCKPQKEKALLLPVPIAELWAPLKILSSTPMEKRMLLWSVPVNVLMGILADFTKLLNS